MPSWRASRHISNAISQDFAPSSTSGRMWQWISTMDRLSTQPSIVELGESSRSRVLVASIYVHNDGTGIFRRGDSRDSKARVGLIPSPIPRYVLSMRRSTSCGTCEYAARMAMPRAVLVAHVAHHCTNGDILVSPYCFMTTSAAPPTVETK
jgi:hypothetical protein